MKVKPNPQCKYCKHRNMVDIYGFGDLVGWHNICSTEAEPFEINGIVFTTSYNDEVIIDGFTDMDGECDYFDKHDLDSLDSVTRMLVEFV